VLAGGGHLAEHLRLLLQVAADGLLGGEPSSVVPVHHDSVGVHWRIQFHIDQLGLLDHTRHTLGWIEEFNS
jgi:hypothetical protein